jgi:hypothetical protein
MSYELYHYGTKGMKWGVRRYQNSDGSLTPAGKKRYERDIQENNSKKKENRIVIDKPDASRWVREDISRTKKTVDATSDLVRQAQKIESNSRKSKTQKMDLSKMTDQEMRSRINRELLERQYSDMFAPQNTSRGRERVRNILETSGTVLTVGSTALGIALAIKELKG